MEEKDQSNEVKNETGNEVEQEVQQEPVHTETEPKKKKKQSKNPNELTVKKKDWDALNQKCEEYLDTAQRIKAEFDNYKKRGLIKIYRIIYNKIIEKIKLEYIQDIQFDKNKDKKYNSFKGFKGSICCITQSKVNGNILISSFVFKFCFVHRLPIYYILTMNILNLCLGNTEILVRKETMVVIYTTLYIVIYVFPIIYKNIKKKFIV